MEITGADDEIVLVLVKGEVAWNLLPVGEHTVEAGRAEVAGGVVLSVHTRGEDGVHIHIRKGVGLSGGDVTKPLVHRPYMHAAGDVFLPRAKAVGPAVGRGDGAVGGDGVVVLGAHLGTGK